MKAVVFEDINQISTDEVADPHIQGPSDVIVQVKCAALCGSDLHIYRGHEQGLDPGTIMGHEFVGEVVALGSEVSKLHKGDWVVSPFTSNCGACYYCQIGLTCRCTQGQLYGWVENGHGLEGAQAEYVRVPMADATLLKFEKHLPPEEVLFCGDILSTGYYCADRADIYAGALVVVLGCGPVGLMTLLAAQELQPTCTLVAVDAVPERLAQARSFGALAVNYRSDDVQEYVKNLTEGRGADIVLEAVGSAAAGRLAFELARPGACISTVGVHTGSQMNFSPVEAYDKNITYRIGRAPARSYMEKMLQLVESKKYPLSQIISHRLGLDQAAHAYKIFDGKKDKCLKVIFDME